MSYQVIARKWRPQIFEEVIGQEAISRTLRNAIEHERLHHAYIFSGARGVGKTTTARLLAKALNCRKTDQPNPTPCDTRSDDACISCREISESRSMDVLEFDAASHTKVDEIREIILESININPARDRFKVFIIDEVHMLSKSSFNALLKTLEEPPENVVFLMATTELHKIPDTILSRVQEFEFRTIPLQKILTRLKTIAQAEQIDISEAGLKEIARSGEGSMRDAQSNFDQVISFSGEKIDTEDVISALGIASAENLTRTIEAIAEKKPKEILQVIDDLIARGQDLRHFCTDLLAFLRDLLVFKMAGDAEHLLDTAILSFEELEKFSKPFLEADLIRFFNSLAETESSLREATEPRFLLEVGLLKLIEMGRVTPVEKLLERLAELEKVLQNRKFELGSEAENTGVSENFENPQNSHNSQSSQSSENTFEKKTSDTKLPPEDTPFPVKKPGTREIEPQATDFRTEDGSPEPENLSGSAGDFSSENQNDSSVLIIEPENSASQNSDSENSNPLENTENHQKIRNFESSANSANPVNHKKAGKSPIIDIDRMPVKLEPIDAEELEHIEDKWLDQAFESRLLQEGDDLKLIRNAGKIVRMLLDIGESESVSVKFEQSARSNGSGVRTLPGQSKENKALEIVSELARTEEIDETMPVLPENPTDEDLWRYAENHPKVKKVLRVFRGKLVEVKRA